MNGKVVIVTGGAGGIGAEVCKAFASQGVMVAVADMDEARAESVAAEVTKAGAEALGVEMDVADENSVKSAVNRTVERFGRVDFLVHCAGNNVKSPLLDMTLEQWRSSLDTHLTGAFLACREAGRQMVKQGHGGRVVLMSSVAAMSPVPDRGAYSPAKAGLSNMARLLSLEWAQYNINVNAIAPGVFETPMNTKLINQPERKQKILSRTPMGRFGNVEEIQGAAIFLASESSNFVTGEVLAVDGGFLAVGI